MDGELTFGAWLKSRRRQLDLTQKGLAHLVGCSVGTIRKMEADERRPSRQLAGLLAECLEIPPDQSEVFIAFARSEPYIADAPLPVLSDAEYQVPIIPQDTKTRNIKHNLSLAVTPFVGREAELDTLDDLFADQDKRLVTILGPGGIGKTRLAVAYAERQLKHGGEVETHPYQDGIFFVDLTPLPEAERLVLHLAEVLNLRIKAGTQEQRSPKQQLLDYLRNKRLLFVLDNFEHWLFPVHSPEVQVGEDGTAVVGEILGNAPYVRILVTSRERLNLTVEQVFAIEGLAYPKSEEQALVGGDEVFVGYTAIQFFMQTAQRSRQDFSLNSVADRKALLKICQLVGGMPLGLELAAAWVDVLPLSDIANEIQHCLDFLETELRDVPDRHRSMRATFDSSWRKLSEREQDVFAKLSIFRGGFTREAAQSITGATLRQLSRLVSKSFIQFNQQQTRYQVHELLHQYGAEWLKRDSELETVLQDHHSIYYCKLLESYTADLKGAGQMQALAAIETDIENVRLAWSGAISKKNLEAIDISAESLFRFYWMSFWPIQGVIEFEKAVVGLRAGNPVGRRRIVLGRILAYLGRLYSRTFQFRQSADALNQSLELLKQFGSREDTLMPLLTLASLPGLPEESNKLLEACLALARELDDQWAIGDTLNNMGMNSLAAGNYDLAEMQWQEALDQFRKNEDMGGVHVVLSWLSILAVDQGRYQEALSLSRRSISISQEKSATDPMMGMMSLGEVLYATGAYEQAEEQFQKGLSIYRETTYRFAVNGYLLGLGKVALQKKDYESAEKYFRESLAGAIEVDQLFLVAQSQDALARLNLALGNRSRAREFVRAALETATPLGRPPILLATFATAAELFAKEKNLAYAALLATFVTNHPASQAKVKERVEELLSQLEEQLSVEDLAEIRQRSQKDDLDNLTVQLMKDLEKR